MEFKTVTILKCKQKPLTRGPWTTSLTWELKSTNTYMYDYHNVDWEKKKPIIYFMRI